MLFEALQALGAFAALSYALRRWPWLLHARKEPHASWPKVWAIAHRGGRVHTPENTLAAFERAAETCDAVELDVWLTSDEEVAVIHDGTLQRVTGEEGHISELSSKDLPQVWQQASDNWPQGKDEPPIEPRKLRVPLLGEVLAVLSAKPNVHLMVEFKRQQPDPLLRQKVLQLLQLHGMLGRTTCFSLNGQVNATLRHVPQFFVCSDVSRVVSVFLLYYSGLLGFVPTRWFDPIFGITQSVMEGEGGKHVGFMERIPVVRSMPAAVQRMLAGHVANFTNTPKLFAHLQERGVLVWCLGVNNPAMVQRSRALCVDSVLADDIDFLVAQRKPKSQ